MPRVRIYSTRANRPLMIGRTLDHYRIDRTLGQGGMGVVYKAYDLRLERAVAVKVLAPDRVGDRDAKQRFAREARAASALNHPGIVTIHDIQSDAGVDFIVMDYIEGTTLDQRIGRTGLPPAEVRRYAAQVADAVAAAHGAGILHRDLKPSNLMITREGRVKVLDFGLAKLLEPAETAGAASTVAGLTMEGTRVGTPAFMSPEQAEGRALDARSDVFSFGAVLYEMSTGRKPFSGDSALAILGRILSEEPTPPSAIVSSIPADLEKLVLRCLRKDPDRRYQTMADLKVALDDLELDRTSVTTRVPMRWGLAVIAAIVLFGGYLAWRTWPARNPVEALRAEALTTFPGPELYPSLSPDGNHVVFTWTGPKQENADVYVQQIGAGAPLRLTTDQGSDYNPVWSPDGRWVAFLRGDPARALAQSARELRLIAPLGGPERKLADIRVQEITVNPVHLTWCPDSTCLVVSDTLGERQPDGLFRVSLDTGEKQPVTTPHTPAIADTNPAFSPDGASLLFLRRTTWGTGDVHVLPLQAGRAAGEPRRIATAPLTIDSVAWHPDGQAILLATPAFAGPAALWTVRATGDSQPERLPYVGEDGVMPAFSRPQSGRPARLVYVRSFTDENIWRLDLPGPGIAAQSPPAVAVASTRADLHPQLSPDGGRVAFTSTRSGGWEIWTSDLDGGKPVQLTSLKAGATGVPHWSPDGQHIVFASDVEGQFDIFIVASAGGKPRNLTSHPAMEHVPIFSGDGRWIYFSSRRSGEFQVWKVPVAGGDPVQVTTEGGWLSQESFDGTDLYFTATPAVGAPVTLWRAPTKGGPAVRVIDGVLNGAFAVSRRGIYYIAVPKAALQFFDFASRRAATIAEDLGRFAEEGGVAVSPDGRFVLFVRRDSSIDDLMLVERFR